MAQFKVYWEIDIEADSAREAAEQALDIQRDPDSEAVYFTVEKMSDGAKVNIDLR